MCIRDRGIGVQREGRSGVSQNSGQCLGVHAAGKGMGGEGVAQVVEADTGQPRPPEPVSYTHLDVYKRQGQMVLTNYLLEQGYTIGAPGEGADVTFVYVNDGNTAVEGCTKGEYDYCITNSCLGYYAENFGAELVGSVKQFVETYPCCRQTCSQEAYENKFDALVAFETATLRGYRYYLENEEATLDILEVYAGEDREFLKAQVYGTDTYTPVTVSYTHLDVYKRQRVPCVPKRGIRGHSQP